MQIPFSEITVGKRFDFGITVLSEQEIIDYAKMFDPLDFHIDKEAAKKSIFKSLVASGPQIFTVVHRNQWITRFGHTVLCGLAIDHWKFLKPIYPNQKIISSATVLSITPNVEKNSVTIKWLYEFLNEQNELVQILEATVLHKIS